MRGSILINFDELINDRGIDSFEVFVNGFQRDIHFTDITNYYSTFCFVGDTINIIVNFSGSTPIFNLERKDFTTDDEGGDRGIKETSQAFTVATGSTIRIYSFTATTRPDAYDFHYVVSIDTLQPTPTPTPPVPTPTPTATPTPTPTATPTPTPSGITTQNLLIYLDANQTNSYSGTGTTWFDLTNNDYDFTLYGGPTFTTTGSTSFFSFDGINDFAKSVSGATNGNDLSSYTIGVWVNNPNTTNTTVLCRNRIGAGGGTSLVIQRFFNPSGGDQFRSHAVFVDPNNVNNFEIVGGIGSTFARNSWYYVVLVFQWNGLNALAFRTMYVNAVKIGGDYEGPLGWQLRGQTGVDDVRGYFIARGADKNTYTPCRVAEVHIYDAQLLPANILENFNRTKFRYGY